MELKERLIMEIALHFTNYELRKACVFPYSREIEFDLLLRYRLLPKYFIYLFYLVQKHLYFVIQLQYDFQFLVNVKQLSIFAFQMTNHIYKKFNRGV